MPELPEVETVVRSLREDVIGRRILDIKNSWPNHLTSVGLVEMRKRVIGSQITGINRRGKYIVFGLSGADTMIIHLKMTGQLLLQPASSAVRDHVHTTFLLSGDDELRFRDVRKFGRVYLTQEPVEILGQLGPEPLSESFTPELLNKMLLGRRRVLKPLLLDQHFIAGIGNIYADESLFHAKLAPNRISNTISEDEGRQLNSSIRTTLQLAVDHGGATISDYRQPDGSKGEMQNSFKVYGRAGEPCGRCDGVVERIILGGRSTFFCASCQI
ncbi:MAG TPA: bifunctional DNA-formamidopyrimidine glycosylase/DNA-(apurinic or apyrimidinic site) lyase [candidate division Zixibacteria bacterium]|nr:bifunctional DNA-formamidopyrimidine glycosylase/DNA-(apurinic or apyrimidinic site) lyase [candidate division Zixibacteria bacterium]